MQINYRVLTCAEGSHRRAKLIASLKRLKLPVLLDANTHSQVVGTQRILRYLQAQYVIPSSMSSSGPAVNAAELGLDALGSSGGRRTVDGVPHGVPGFSRLQSRMLLTDHF